MDLLGLTKPRIVALVVATAAAGYYMALPAAPPMAPAARLLAFVHAIVGTALVAGGTNALNQVLERDVDALMARTAGRAIPAGRVTVAEATAFAWAGGVLGVAYLALLVNAVTAALAALTLVSYAFAYTPLKRRTPLATLVGAIPGALPIVGGWTAAAGVPDGRAWVLFGILFLWQIPHVMALGWIYREDYARAGLRMVSATDPDGRDTFRRAALNAAALVPVTLAPAALGMSGPTYFAGAALLSAWFLGRSLSAARRPSPAAARRLFLASLAYLPAILTLMVLDRLP